MLTSYHEAAPMVFDEAVCLAVPILATQTTSTDEMITSAKAGFVCNNTNGDIENSLLSIISNRDSLNDISNSLKNSSFTNEKAKEIFNVIVS
jgi:glycosyltransferase involved in cell wall biosynthesis